MSAKLEKALAMKQVLVRKNTTGEVKVTFESKDVKDVVLSHRGIVDLLSKRGVTVEAIRNSNLKELIQKRYVEVL
jgi:xylose isomerase